MASSPALLNAILRYEGSGSRGLKQASHANHGLDRVDYDPMIFTCNIGTDTVHKLAIRGLEACERDPGRIVRFTARWKIRKPQRSQDEGRELGIFQAYDKDISPSVAAVHAHTRWKGGRLAARVDAWGIRWRNWSTRRIRRAVAGRCGHRSFTVPFLFLLFGRR